MYGLNKPYLSYSAIDLWLKSPTQYRKRYYEQRPQPITPELSFGKKIATLLEASDESLAHIPRYAVSEKKISTEIDGVPILAYLDSYDPDGRRILEFKTGKQPWTDARVQNHKQLDLYSLLVEMTEGSVTDTTTLIWLETERVAKPQTGLLTAEESYDIALTGEVKTFERVITPDDRRVMRELVVRVASEIAADYEAQQSLQGDSSPFLGLPALGLRQG